MNYDSSIISSIHSDTIAEQQQNLRKQHKKLIAEIKSKDPEGATNMHTSRTKLQMKLLLKAKAMALCNFINRYSSGKKTQK